jgi:VanZ family protein
MKNRKRIFLIIFILYNIIVLLLSILPSYIFRKVPYMETFSFADKIAHVLIYLVYILVLCSMLYYNINKKKVISYGVLYTILIGVLMEFVQMIIKGAGRTGSFGDIVANTIGTIIGAIIVHAVLKKLANKSLSTD